MLSLLIRSQQGRLAMLLLVIELPIRKMGCTIACGGYMVSGCGLGVVWSDSVLCRIPTDQCQGSTGVG